MKGKANNSLVCYINTSTQCVAPFINYDDLDVFQCAQGELAAQFLELFKKYNSEGSETAVRNFVLFLEEKILKRHLREMSDAPMFLCDLIDAVQSMGLGQMFKNFCFKNPRILEMCTRCSNEGNGGAPIVRARGAAPTLYYLLANVPGANLKTDEIAVVSDFEKKLDAHRQSKNKFFEDCPAIFSADPSAQRMVNSCLWMHSFRQCKCATSEELTHWIWRFTFEPPPALFVRLAHPSVLNSNELSMRSIASFKIVCPYAEQTESVHEVLYLPMSFMLYYSFGRDSQAGHYVAGLVSPYQIWKRLEVTSSGDLNDTPVYIYNDARFYMMSFAEMKRLYQIVGIVFMRTHCPEVLNMKVKNILRECKNAVAKRPSEVNHGVESQKQVKADESKQVVPAGETVNSDLSKSGEAAGVDHFSIVVMEVLRGSQLFHMESKSSSFGKPRKVMTLVNVSPYLNVNVSRKSTNIEIVADGKSVLFPLSDLFVRDLTVLLDHDKFMDLKQSGLLPKAGIMFYPLRKFIAAKIK